MLAAPCLLEYPPKSSKPFFLILSDHQLRTVSGNQQLCARIRRILVFSDILRSQDTLPPRHQPWMHSRDEIVHHDKLAVGCSHKQWFERRWFVLWDRLDILVKPLLIYSVPVVLPVAQIFFVNDEGRDRHLGHSPRPTGWHDVPSSASQK